jgi:hypothetical protein
MGITEAFKCRVRSGQLEHQVVRALGDLGGVELVGRDALRRAGSHAISSTVMRERAHLR